MSKRTKWSVGIVLLVVVVAIIGIGAANRGGKGTVVRVDEVQRRDLVASVTGSGQIQPHSKVDLSADISGRIVRLAVREGQMVTKGQFLLEIDPSTYQAAVQRMQAALFAARADLARAQANLSQASSNHQRSAEIRKANVTLVSDEQMEQLRTAVEVNEALFEAARYQVAQAEAGLRDARSNLAKTTITAPMSGRITRLNVEQGETAIMGTLNREAALLLTISDMGLLETKVRVDETQVARISVGDSAIVEIDAFPDTTFTGRVVEISNSSIRRAAAGPTDQAVDYEVRIQLVNAPPETRPDFSATAKIVTAQRSSALSIPIIALTVQENEALQRGDTAATAALGRQPVRQVGRRDVEGVFVVGEDNKVSFRPIRVGIAGEEYFEVLEGLQEGERIVAGSYQAIRGLKDGTLVREQPRSGTTSGDRQ
jgi:HlyD family secretion protein